MAIAAALTLAATVPGVWVPPAHAEDPALSAAPDSARVVRGTAVEVDVLANDTGPDGGPLLEPDLEITVPPAHGRADVLDEDGPGGEPPVIRYVPALDAPAQDTLEYRVTDQGLTATTHVEFTIDNAPPTAADDTAQVTSAPGDTVVIDVLANDSDPDGGTLAIVSVTTPGPGTATIESGAIRYDPLDDYVGPDAFTYTITDGQGGEATASVTITVTDPTSPMTLRPDTIRATAGVPVAVPVLANDLSGGRDPLTVVATTPPASGGTAVIATDGKLVTYTAPATFTGTDTFTYTVRDRRGNTASALVTATVSAPAVPATIAAAIPTTLRVGRLHRIPVTVTGLDATGLSAQLQREKAGAWVTVASGAMAASGGTIRLRPTIDIADLGPGRHSGPVTLRVLLETTATAGAASGNTPGPLATDPTTVTARADVRLKVSGPLTRAAVRYSYRPGCPVGPSSLRRITLNHWDYAGQLRRGRLIVRWDAVRDLRYVFSRAFYGGFQVKKVVPIDRYYRKGRRSPTASDMAAMRAGNTSAFNCRPVVGNPTKRSTHSYGVAIDINTFENPYVVRGGFYPTRAGEYLRRTPCRVGMICPGDVIATAMQQRGWPWGARWWRPDYQHFSANGG